MIFVGPCVLPREALQRHMRGSFFDLLGTGAGREEGRMSTQPTFEITRDYLVDAAPKDAT